MLNVISTERSFSFQIWNQTNEANTRQLVTQLTLKGSRTGLQKVRSFILISLQMFNLFRFRELCILSFRNCMSL